MPTITVTFDPDVPGDADAAARLVARFTDPSGEPAVADGSVDPDQLLRDRVTGLVRGYGTGRHNYLRVVAEASPSAARYEEIEQLFDSPKAIGGTHSSIERSWRSMGAPADIIDTDMHGNSRMDPSIARVVLEVLDEFPATS